MVESLESLYDPHRVIQNSMLSRKKEDYSFSKTGASSDPSLPPQHGRCVPACPRCGGKVDDGRKWGKLGEGEGKEVDASCGLRNVTRLHYAITDGKNFLVCSHP